METLLLAVFTALLHRMSGQPEVLVAIPPMSPTAESADGSPALAPLALRSELAEELPFGAHLGRVRAELEEARAHAICPWELLGIAPPPVAFALRPAGGLPRHGAKELSRVPLAVVATAFDLDLRLEETPEGGVLAQLVYRRELFDPTTMRRFLEAFHTLLDAIAAEPELPVAALPLAGAVERQELLREWNDSESREESGVLEPPGCLHEWVSAQALRTPAAVAIATSAGAPWTYGELEGRSNRLARHLRRLGVGPEVRVGVCLERTPDLVMALLAVLKAGGAYVPLDPAYPAERLRFMLEDSGATVVLTQRETESRGEGAGLPAIAGCREVEIGSGGRLNLRADSFGRSAQPVVRPRIQTAPGPDLGADIPGVDAWAGESPAALPPLGGAGNLAYLIYTSGSTGRPKGVAIEHRSAVQLLRWARQVFPAADLAGVLAATSICFDLSIFELFLPLSQGGRVVLVPNALALGQLPPPLRDTVTLINTVPSVMAELIRARAVPSSVRTVCLAGEPLKWSLVEAIHGAVPAARVLNLYGPSEDTTYSTWALMPRDGEREPEIGRPISGTRAYVLDGALSPLPLGVAGELYLGGAGLARGYLGRPELTAERFLPDPSGSAGSRLYRTGDRARHRPEGGLEFLGRLDHQVKVRGFRVELGEIEAVLARHPTVGDVAVVVRPDAAGERQLVAYLEADIEAGEAVPGLAAEEIRAWLARRLPSYMVPTLFQVLAALPRTPNLKVDRRALPALDLASTGATNAANIAGAAGAAGRAAGTPLERFLAGVAGELLGMPEVAADADLLALGAHSLLVAQLVTRVRQGLDLDLSLADVFEARTVAALAERLEARRQRGEGPTIPPLRPVPRGGDLPLSFAQERVWFLEQMSPGNLAYNFQFSLRFRGAFDPGALAAACTEVIRRHEIFRTTFPAPGGRPVQLLHPPFAVRIPQVDLSALPDPVRREAEAERQISAALKVPFVITRLPLIRWTLFRLAAEDHVLLHVEHHFVHDGWSIGLVQEEIRKLYRATVEGETATLPPPGAQYVEYAVWQREWLKGEVLARQLDFWQRRLAGSPPRLELPADRPRPAVQGFSGDVFFVLLPSDLYGALRHFGRRSGGSLFITMLAAFDTLLHRLSGQDDVVLGTGIANRRLRELETMIGMVVSTVVLRNDLAGRPSFRELVERTRGRVLELHEYQDTPFEHLVAQLSPERHLDQNPLYQVMFAFHDAPMPELRFGDGLATELRYRHNGSAKADLNVIGIPHAEQRRGLPPGAAEEEMLLLWEYSTDLFDRTTAQRMWNQYLEILGGAVLDPALRLDELPLLSTAERQQLLREWNASRPAAPENYVGDLHGLFEVQAARRPLAPALVLGERRLCYGELDRLAAQLAARLAVVGVGSEVRVGLYVERSVELIVGLLGILKAGGAYVPLDPMYPVERRDFLIVDSRMRAVVAGEALAGGLAAGGLPTVVLDSGASEGEAADEPGTLPATLPALPGGLAYVIYTSGSTGRPKGVGIEHRSAVNVVRAAIRDFGVGEGSRVLQLASISFDASVLEIFMTLGSGGTLYLVDPETRLSHLRLEELIRAHDVDVVVSPPSLLDTLAADSLPSISTVIVGGEATSAETFQRWASGRRFFNCYAPTETTIYSTFERCDERRDERWEEDRRRAPILGRPIDGTRIHLLDRFFRPVPLGVAGEIYVGGTGVARGYLGRPELTAERFLPDAFAARAGAGARLYRTGDLARLLGDGRLEFLGRFDQQVKIRGLRIELGEIEAVAAQHPAVREVVVTVDRGAPADPRLLAYVVPRDPASPPPSLSAELRELLQAKLPGYMVPAHIVVLEALPINVQGKVDLKALPAPVAASPLAFLAPAGAVEEMLAEIWGGVLGVDRVGARDNFFELGGHSLLAAQVMARVADAFALRLPVRLLFESPTLRHLAAAVSTAVHSAKGTAGPPLPPFERVSDDQPPRLSFAQQRLWFLDQLEPGNPAYNVGFAYRLRGPFSAPSLAAALVAMAARHEPLRTTFESSGGWPAQRVAPTTPTTEAPGVPLAVVDLAGLPAEHRESEAARRAEEEAGRPCDLAAGPPLRAVALRLAAEHHLLLLLSHHIVLDGSAQLFLRELATLYRAAERRTEPLLPPLPFRYTDFAHWQRRWLAGEVLETQIEYWTRQLGGDLPPLELPTDRPRPAVRDVRGGHYAFTLRGGLGEGVRALARQHGATLFMTLLAAFDVLLHRYSGQTELAVGFPIADRPHPDLEGMIGCFVNTLVLRASLAGEPRFSDLLARVRETTLDAYAHKDLPFETLVDALNLARDLRHTPLFQVLFVSHATPPPRLDLPGIETSRFPLESGGARFDWLLLLRPEGGELRGQIEYSQALFDRTTIVRLIDHLDSLLAGIVADPGAGIATLPFLAAGERHQLITEWNDTAPSALSTTSEAPRPIHQLVAEQAARTPDAVAVIDDGGAWTYRDLDRHANRIAHLLRHLGVRLGSPVGVHLERSAEMVAALLAVLKAGGTYVPLEARLPAERLRFVLARLSARHLLTSQALWARLDEPLRGSPSLDGVIALDAPAGADLPAGGRLAGKAEIAAQRAEDPNVAVPSEALAYVIFTSGSTGFPKGVAVRHRSVHELIQWINRDFGVGPDDRVLFLTAVGFDLSVYDMFGLLAAGGSVRVVASGDVRDPERLLALLLSEPITFWDSAPAALQQLAPFLPAAPGEGSGSLRRVFLSGDWIPTTLPDRLRAAFPAARVVSLGGATEATVWSNVFPIAAVDPRWTSIPYGRPMPGARYHVLDARFEPSPVGVEGDLYIAGECLATGYAGEPGLTAERFVPDPFGGVGGIGGMGGRLYWTGDRARSLADGNLEFRGRRDQQVKIRGFRVELGEIEAILAQHPAVREAVVIADGLAGARSLVAYLVPRAEPVPLGALREYVAARLPEYMVPGAVVHLAALPLNANGKLDRKALPRPHEAGLPAGLSAEHAVVAPRTPTEATLARLWSEVLGRSPIGVHDDFFDLGGHSLLATQLASRIREALEAELPLRIFFENPTIAGLARCFDSLHGVTDAAALPRLVPRPPAAGPPPLSFAQQRLWFLDQLEPGTAVYNMPFSLRLAGSLEVSALVRGLAEIVRRHDTLRTRFVSDGGLPRQVIRAPGEPLTSLPRIDLRQLPAAAGEPAVRELAAALAARPFDLQAGPLVIFALVELAAGEHRLLVNLHHIVSDGWSIGIFLAELGALYPAFAAGRPSPLAELEVQYGDFAIWQRGWLQGEVLAAQLGYWRERLAGAPAVLELPTDRPRPPAQSYRGGRRPLQLPPRLAEELRRLSRQSGTTLFMTLLGAFQALVGQATGETDVPVGSPIANRRVARVEGLIGFFVNSLVLRADLAGDPGFDQLLEATREAALGAYAHQDVPFEQLVEELEPERDLRHAPLFQVLFVLQNDPWALPRLPSLEVTLEPIDSGISKYDLSLVLTETGGALEGGLTYSLDLFDATSVERLARRFVRLVEEVVANPERPLSLLPLLSPVERHAILLEANDTDAGPAPRLAPEMVAAHCAATPEAEAVRYGADRLSFAELDRRAEGLARRLRSLGVVAETPVGLFLDRCLDLLPAILGIWKAGGAFVPLSPDHPPERLAFLLADAQIRVVVTREDLAAKLPADLSEHQGAVVCLDAGTGFNTGAPGAAPADPGNPDASWGPWDEAGLAYILYTSGSTGRPKGTLLSHGGLAHYLRFCHRAYPLAAGAPVYTSLSFDLTLTSLLAPLTAGWPVTLLPEDHAVETLVAAMRPPLPATAGETGGWGFVKLTPAHLEILNHQLAPTELGGRTQALLLGGEALRFEDLAPWRAHAPAIRLINEYGPTETVVGCSIHEVSAAEPAAGPVPIGRPISGARLHVLGADFEPQPFGSPGELCVAGAGLARGYLGRPDLTAERFLPDPFSPLPGGRLYRTGDRARYRADGVLSFLGRLDQQVKLHGYRIEPGEIEGALRSLSGVRDAVVVVRQDASNVAAAADDASGAPADRRLVAYVTGEGVQTSALRSALKDRLPDYMVPAFFVHLPELPLASNGKVDRRALPVPEADGPSLVEEVPRTPYEDLVANVFSTVLGRPEIARQDNFFDLGGHSLLAVQVLARLRVALGVELPLREIFEHPTMAELAARLAEMQRGARVEPPLLPAAAAAEGSRAPLSFAQERLWIIDRMAPGNPTYNVPAALRLRGRLGVEALRQALGALVRRQAALRTRFELADDGEPVQVVESPRAWELPLLDLSGLPLERREAESRHQAEAEARRPFDLSRGPLLRTLLLRLAASGEEHALVLDMHHIVSDGASINIFYRELGALYAAAFQGTTAALPDLPIQYTDFARWQRRWAAERDLDAQLAYWRRQLADAPAVLDLPLDHPRPAVQTHRGGRIVRGLSAALGDRLRRLARDADATFFMTLLAGFEVLLGRWTGQGDLAVGTPVANRSRSEVEGLVGFFVNTLVLRTELAADLSFRDLLARVRRVALEAYSHQDLPFEHLVDVLKPQRDLRYSPLFQVMFSYHESTVVSRQLPGLVLTSSEVDPRSAKFDLTLFLRQDELGLRAILEYNADLFDGTTLARLGRQLETLLTGLAADPRQSLCELPLLALEERAQVLREWNDTTAGPNPRLAPDLVAAQAAVTPDALAVRFRDGRLSFSALERRANRLANHLLSLGVTAETPVGLHLDRGLDLLPAILGIWKAGGAFVPLPPDHPTERLAYILSDASIRVVVSRVAAPPLPEFPGTVVRLDADAGDAGDTANAANAGDAAAIALCSPEAPPFPAIAEGLAYILYTSGSTGRPKGTLVSHRGFAHYLRFCHAAYPLDGGAPVFTSLSFDLTLTSLFAPLTAGRPVTLLPEDHAVETLAAVLRPPRESGGSGGLGESWGLIKLTPAHLELVSHTLAAAELAGRSRALILGGEALRFEPLAAWRERSPATRLFNEYGPTETVVGCSVHEVTSADPTAGAVPIGRPIPGARLHVLGSSGEPLPLGSPGELCVAGDGLARGYLGRPDLTAERFVPDPYASLPGGRLYRTGDRARYRADGVLTFLGRLDQQVKLNGYRIELGEIEAVLRRHAGVQAAAVVVRDDLPGGRGLAAYWVAAGEATSPISPLSPISPTWPEAAELRRFLALELPEYMVPAAFTRLPELPLDRHGKLDSRALPAPEGPVRVPTVPWSAPETDRERRLATLVGEILRLSKVGRDDNFFDLGAHSITLVRLHERLVRLDLGEVTVIDLFRYPTVRSLADHLGRAGTAAPAESGTARVEARESARDLRQRSRDRRQKVRSS